VKTGTGLVLLAALAMLATSIGCDRELDREVEVDVRNGTVEREETIIRERPDGTIEQEEIETRREIE
jgi:hypothetical protein